MPPPLVSAIVLNYRTPQHAVRCVQALLKQAMSPELWAQSSKLKAQDLLEVIVVDNHSQDDSIGVLHNRLARFPTVRIVESADNRGFARGNNLGTRFATGRYLLIINPDNELLPGSLEQMVHTMEADPSIGLLAPMLLHEDGSVRHSVRTFPSIADVLIKRTILQKLCQARLAKYLQLEEDPTRQRDVDWVVGACMLIRADTYHELKGLDERFFLFFEDMDLCRRLRQVGKRVVYFPQARAADRKHRLSEGSVLTLPFKRAGRAHVKSAVKYFWKWRK